MTPQGNINFTTEQMENAKGDAMPARRWLCRLGCVAGRYAGLRTIDAGVLLRQNQRVTPMQVVNCGYFFMAGILRDDHIPLAY